MEGRSQRVRAPSTFSLEAEAAKGAVSEFERLKLGETRSLADAQKDSDWQQEVQAMRTAGQYQPAILAAAAAADAAASQPEPTVKVRLQRSMTRVRCLQARVSRIFLRH